MSKKSMKNVRMHPYALLETRPIGSGRSKNTSPGLSLCPVILVLLENISDHVFPTISNFSISRLIFL